MLQRQKVAMSVVLGGFVISCVVIFFAPNVIWYAVLPFFSEWTPAAIKFSVRSANDGRPIFDFNQSSVDYNRHPFLSFEVFELVPSNPSRWRRIWAIGEITASNKVRNSIVYGECPDGFTEIVPPEPLITGHFYKVNASDVIRKNGTQLYEVIPFAKYQEGVKSGLYKDAE